jgi:hypothetical protein
MSASQMFQRAIPPPMIATPIVIVRRRVLYAAKVEIFPTGEDTAE